MCSTIRNIIKYYEILNNANITYKNIDSVHSKIYNNIINNYVLHASYLASIKPITNSSNFRDLIANVNGWKKQEVTITSHKKNNERFQDSESFSIFIQKTF